MGFFRRKQTVHFERDEYGKVVNVEKTGDRMGESRTPVSDALIKKQTPRQPQQKKPSRLIEFGKKVDRAVVNYNRRRNPLTTGRGRPGPRNANPFGSVFDTGMNMPKKPKTKTQYVVVKGKAYPKAKQKSKGGSKKKRGKRGGRPEILDFDPFGDNWGLDF